MKTNSMQGMSIDPLFGTFRFDMFGRTAYLYCLGVLLLTWLLWHPALMALRSC
jgi:branched-chain amino acid transport system permease protein